MIYTLREDDIMIIKAIVLGVGAVIALAFFNIAFRLLRSDKGEYDLNRKRSGDWSSPFSGRVKTCHDGQRDYRVRAGLAIDKQTNTWVEQGILSDDAVDAVLRPKTG